MRFDKACECKCGNRYCAGNRSSLTSPLQKRDRRSAEYRADHDRSVLDFHRKQQAESLARARHHYSRWAPWELDLLVRRDLTRRQIAQMTGRTMYAVGSAKKKIARDPRWGRLLERNES